MPCTRMEVPQYLNVTVIYSPPDLILQRKQPPERDHDGIQVLAHQITAKSVGQLCAATSRTMMRRALLKPPMRQSKLSFASQVRSEPQELCIPGDKAGHQLNSKSVRLGRSWPEPTALVRLSLYYTCREAALYGNRGPAYPECSRRSCKAGERFKALVSQVDAICVWWLRSLTYPTWQKC
jgi:hypothetical protein